MRIISAITLSLAVLLVSGAPTLVQAKPARTQPDPQVFDLSDRADPARRPAQQTTQQDCFVEPEGFHSQIRWDGDCVKARQLRQQGTSTSGPTRFDAPRGFHSQIRWD